MSVKRSLYGKLYGKLGVSAPFGLSLEKCMHHVGLAASFLGGSLRIEGGN